MIVGQESQIDRLVGCHNIIGHLESEFDWEVHEAEGLVRSR
jgi:hypothetical protein